MSKHIATLLLFCCSFSFAQQKSIDSLWNKINKAALDSQKVNSLNKLFGYYSTTNNDSALIIAEKALEIAKIIKYEKGEAASYNNLGTVYFYTGNNAKALTSFLAAAKIHEKHYDEKSIKDASYNENLSTSYNNIGIIYQRQKLYEQAENYFRKSIAIDEKTGDKIGLAHCYNNIGTIKEETNKYDEAIKNYEIALQLKQEVNDTLGIPSTLINMAVIRMNQNKFHESLAYLEKAYSMSVRANNIQDQALVLINKGDLFYLTKDYPTAIVNYQKGIEICKSQNYFQFLSYAYNNVSLAYYYMKDFQKAYDYYQKYTSTKDSLYNSENAKVLHELEAKYETEGKEKEIKLLTSDKEIKDLELNKKKIIIYAFIGGSILLAFFVFMALRANVQKRKINQELDIKNQKIEVAYKIIEIKQKEIVDSINYAKRIQYTLLAHDEYLKQNIKEHFILFKPKDIVSGDFYWATRQGNKFYLAVCDSTGHGVPGAFMSLLNIGFMSEAINEKGIEKPNEVFNHVRKRLVENMSKEKQKDGFDGILICVEDGNKTITYAAAHNKPIVINNNEIKILTADKMPVGIGELTHDFNLYSFNMQEGDTLYLQTDGLADQFGGPKGKKFMYKRLNELLLEIHSKPLNEQHKIIETEFEGWRGDLEQIDDVCVVGVRV
ncbi:MAG: tetratricopeptide repeat protein [Bacteroidota bacterium]